LIESIFSTLAARLPHRTHTRARIRSCFSRYPLPPGDWLSLEELERSNRSYILDQASRIGPIFKALAWSEPWICVIGLPLGRRLLREHGHRLTPKTLHLEPLFPKGFLRQMKGDTHRYYRKALGKAIRSADLTACADDLGDLAASHLATYAASGATTSDTYISAINAIASGMLIRLFFGAPPGTPVFDRLMENYRKLGPYGLVWNVGPAQEQAFCDIREQLQGFDGDAIDIRSILGRLRGEEALDDTMYGNLIYMVEMGRYDTHSLFRWLTKYAADHPEYLDRIALESASPPTERRSFTEAFVLETLRMDQSERLLRKVESDFIFEGLLFPKGSTVRVCLWESHKSDKSFEDPLRFDPFRFMEGDPGRDEFSPFGLDHHQCPLADMAIRTSMIFLHQLAQDYQVLPSGDGLPVRGAYHWEPASRFSVRLLPRHSSSQP
jgi:cytochrome P450